MPQIDRRRFLQLAGGTAALSVLTPSIARAAQIPAHRAHGSLEDVEHIVVLMQENRSFDHYFGTMRGVRGFGDPHPVVLPSGKPVWFQSDGTTEILPFRPDVDNLGFVFIRDLDHGWNSGHAMFNMGQYDNWIPAKSSTTMAHLQREDIPFHYALADAFTICDNYHCSLLGPTDPNRYYMWTGWTGNDGSGGGPVIANDELGYSWTTYPERLEAAGISWKIYQDQGFGLDAAGVWGFTEDAFIGNYGDNSLLYFNQYRTAAPGNPLFDKARTGTNANAGEGFFDILAADVQGGRLPQISWIVAPEGFTEHPNWPANFGAWYVARVLDALTSDPDVWSRTVLLLNYDEDDGFFDHVVPPYPNSTILGGESTVSVDNELFTGSEGVAGNFGLGVRVPMIAISPWSTGGWVCSEIFDHSSIIRFMEARFGVYEPNITPWRRAVCGDLTSAFDFSRSRAAVPRLPDTSSFQPPDDDRHPDFVPVPPADPALPTQERGVRPSRPLGYDIDLRATVSATGLAVRIANAGSLGIQIQARSQSLPDPLSYTVAPGTSVQPKLPVAGEYDVSFHGPNGFFRRLAGDSGRTTLEVAVRHSPAGLKVVITNAGSSDVVVEFADAYTHRAPRTVRVPARRTEQVQVETGSTGGWYDVRVTSTSDRLFLRQFAGRIETGRPSFSDPQFGGGR